MRETAWRRTRRKVTYRVREGDRLCQEQPDLKLGASGLPRRLGLIATQAITLLGGQVELQRGPALAVRVPTDVTVEALEQARTRQAFEGLNTLNDPTQDLGI